MQLLHKLSRNNDVAVSLVRQIVLEIMGGRTAAFKHCLNEWATFLIFLYSILIYIVL